VRRRPNKYCKLNCGIFLVILIFNFSSLFFFTCHLYLSELSLGSYMGSYELCPVYLRSIFSCFELPSNCLNFLFFSFMLVGYLLFSLCVCFFVRWPAWWTFVFSGNLPQCYMLKLKVKVHTLDTAHLRSEPPPQKCSGMTHVLEGFYSFTCTPTRSSAIGMSHTCPCLPSRSWYSFTDPGGLEGWVDLGAK